VCVCVFACSLVTFWPEFLLLDPATDPRWLQQLVAQVIVHELSHQWFGDSVTMPWWSQVYLNEGFARYLQYAVTMALRPSWDLWTESTFDALWPVSFFDFAYSDIFVDALGLDHPTVMADALVPGDPLENEDAFGGPAYEKGASLNRMLINRIGVYILGICCMHFRRI
jgi:aminopeptidase N